MGNWLVNAYFIGFFVSLVIFLLTFSGIMREQYVWKKTFWTVPYEDKSDRPAVYGSALFAAAFWPIIWAVTIVVLIMAFLYGCYYYASKKLR